MSEQEQTLATSRPTTMKVVSTTGGDVDVELGSKNPRPDRERAASAELARGFCNSPSLDRAWLRAV